MNPKTMIFIVLMALVVLFIIGWLVLMTGPAEEPPTTVPADVFRPVWFDLQDDPNQLFVYAKEERPYQVEAETAAEEAVILEAPSYIRIYALDLMTVMLEEGGEPEPHIMEKADEIVDIVSNQAYPSAALLESETHLTEDDTFITYVRYAVPFEDINNSILELIDKTDDLHAHIAETASYRKLQETEMPVGVEDIDFEQLR